MKRLTDKSFWSKNYEQKKKRKKLTHPSRLSSLSMYFFDLYKIIKPYLAQNGKIIEIGCAPGHVICELARKSGMEPFGVEYTDTGCALTKETFLRAGQKKNNVYCSDFFSPAFQKKNKNKYDVVSSFGFIEHFENPSKAVNSHVNLLKKGGILIISVPNLTRGNKILSEQDILDKHNLKIMDKQSLANAMPKNVEVLKITYFGGPFNIALFGYKNKILEFLKTGTYLLQRAIFDPVFMFLRILGIKLNNKAFSPSIIIIARKK